MAPELNRNGGGGPAGAGGKSVGQLTSINLTRNIRIFGIMELLCASNNLGFHIEPRHYRPTVRVSKNNVLKACSYICL